MVAIGDGHIPSEIAGGLIKQALDGASQDVTARTIEAHLHANHPEADDRAVTSLAVSMLLTVMVGGTAAGMVHAATGASATAFLMTLDGPQPASGFVMRMYSRQINLMERGRDQWEPELILIEEFINEQKPEDSAEAASLMVEVLLFSVHAAAVSIEFAAANLPFSRMELLTRLLGETLPTGSTRPKRSRRTKRKKRR